MVKQAFPLCLCALVLSLRLKVQSLHLFGKLLSQKSSFPKCKCCFSVFLKPEEVSCEQMLLSRHMQHKCASQLRNLIVIQPFVFCFRDIALSFSPQSSLTKFAESLQEMINYHTVCCHCHMKPDVLSLSHPHALLDSWAMIKPR